MEHHSIFLVVIIEFGNLNHSAMNLFRFERDNMITLMKKQKPLLIGLKMHNILVWAFALQNFKAVNLVLSYEFFLFTKILRKFFVYYLCMYHVCK